MALIYHPGPDDPNPPRPAGETPHAIGPETPPAPLGRSFKGPILVGGVALSVGLVMAPILIGVLGLWAAPVVLGLMIVTASMGIAMLQERDEEKSKSRASGPVCRLCGERLDDAEPVGASGPGAARCPECGKASKSP